MSLLEISRRNERYLHMSKNWKYIALMLYLLLHSLLLRADEPGLFLIKRNGLYGYMDVMAKERITPKYKAAHDFSEGLAAVREQGYYGFIDSSGKYVIAPKYEQVLEGFANNLAVVINKGQTCYINKTGEEVLQKGLRKVRFVSRDVAVITTSTLREGILNVRTKKWLLDTGYYQVKSFANGRAVVNKKIPSNDPYRQRWLMGVISVTGQQIVDFGQYKDIGTFNNGVAMVELKSKHKHVFGVIDSMGKLLRTFSFGKDTTVNLEVSDGMAYLMVRRKDKKAYYGYTEHTGLIDLTGRIIWVNPATGFICGVMDNYVTAYTSNENYRVFNLKTGAWEDSLVSLFIVENAEPMIKVTTQTNSYFNWQNHIYPVTDACQSMLHFDSINKVMLFRPKDNDFVGMMNTEGRVLLSPQISSFDERGFMHGLLKTLMNSKLTYLNTEGKVVWQEEDTLSDTLDIDYKNYHFYKRMRIVKDESGKTVVGVQLKRITETVGMDTRKEGRWMFAIINNSGYEVVLHDIEVVLQAKNENGEWKDIEGIPPRACTDGDVISKIPNKHQAFFYSPVYTGVFQTSLRLKSKMWLRNQRMEIFELYSEEFAGSINPGQFYFNNNAPDNPFGLTRRSNMIVKDY